MSLPLLPEVWAEDLAAEVSHVPDFVRNFISRRPPPTEDEVFEALERDLRERIAFEIAPWLVGKDLS